MSLRDHCLVKDGDTLIPLIGIDPGAGLERCDICGRVVALWEVEFDGKKFVCFRCKIPEFRLD